jgi:hypothetical protein
MISGTINRLWSNLIEILMCNSHRENSQAASGTRRILRGKATERMEQAHS